MKFFVPRTKTVETEAVYGAIVDSLKSQFRLPIDNRRIFSLSYVNGKKQRYAQVGQLEEQEGGEIVAILESKAYIVFAHSKTGDQRLTIMVDKSEVTKVEEFE